MTAAHARRSLQVAADVPGIDRPAAARAVADLLRALGKDPDAEHLCMSLRGVRATGSRTVTSALHGLVRDDARTRTEFFSLTGLAA